MLIIRLTRRGRRNDPSFKLVVTEKSNPVKGKFLEELGFLNPKTKAKAFEKERILHWISKGAKCSATVNNLLISEGVMEGKKVRAWRPKKRNGQGAPQTRESKVKEPVAQTSAPDQEPAPNAKTEQPAEAAKAPEQKQV